MSQRLINLLVASPFIAISIWLLYASGRQIAASYRNTQSTDHHLDL